MEWEFLLYLSVLLLFAKVVGGFLHRYGFPSLVGEVAVGIVLGPTLLGWIAISEGVPTRMITDAITAIAMLGLVVLMLVVGMNSRFDLLAQVKFKALLIALCGMAVAFVFGFAVPYAAGYDLLACVFVGAALSSTATEVVARAVEKHAHAQLMVSAALIDDISAVYVLGILSASVLKGTLDLSVVMWSTLGLVVFFIAVAYLSRKLIMETDIMRRLWRFEKGVPMTFVVCLALGLATIAHTIGLHAIIGAYMAGLFISRLREKPDALLLSRIRLNAILDDVTNSLQSILTPMFFVFIGLSIPRLGGFGLAIPLLLALMVAAFAGKIIGCGVGAAAVGYRGRDCVAIGTAMCPRGSLEMAVLLFGLEAGFVPLDLFSVMVVTTLSTTLLTPVLFKFISK